MIDVIEWGWRYLLAFSQAISSHELLLLYFCAMGCGAFSALYYGCRIKTHMRVHHEKFWLDMGSPPRALSKTISAFENDDARSIYAELLEDEALSRLVKSYRRSKRLSFCVLVIIWFLAVVLNVEFWSKVVAARKS